MEINKFSVVIPLYNMEKFIKRTIKSVLNQTYREFEILVINDGSTDKSIEKISDIKNSRLKIFTKSNGGVSEARNYGIKKAKYDYIAFLDADDEWEPEFLENINLMINNYSNAGAYATGYKFKYSNNTEKIPKNIKKIKPNFLGYISDYFKYSYEIPLISASSVVIKKSVFKSIGMFDSELNRGEDKKMWSTIAVNYKVCFNSKILAIYNIDASSRRNLVEYEPNKSFMSYSRQFYEENKDKPFATKYFKYNMYNYILYDGRLRISSGEKNIIKPILSNFKIEYLTLINFWKLILKFIHYRLK